MTNHWQPSANFSLLRTRATLINRIRDFFHCRDFLEVETPLLGRYTVTDRHIESIPVNQYYLQTSPEYAMKRLLAAGSGPIFQISKAFRHQEQGRYHNPEFTLLEWYHPGLDHNQLMDEVEDLLTATTPLMKADRYTYQALFERFCDLNPLSCSDAMISKKLTRLETLSLKPEKIDRDTGLQLLFTEMIEPHLGHDTPTFVYDFPASQAALAKISRENPLVCERFEVFIKGMEIGNGFHELTDADEQLRRFKTDQAYRLQQQKSAIDIDDRFMAALISGLPECAGIAVGIDRLLMSLADKNEIKEVISFDWERA